LEENKANYLAVGSNFAFVIGKSFEVPLSPIQLESPSNEVLPVMTPQRQRGQKNKESKNSIATSGINNSTVTGLHDITNTS